MIMAPRKTTAKAADNKAAEVKAEVKAPAATAAKPVEKKAEAPAAKPVEKKAEAPAAKPAEKKAEAPAAKAAEKKAAPARKTAQKKAAPAKKPAEKKAAPAKKTAKAEPAKRAPRKAKEVTIDDICAKLYKKIDAAKAAKLTDTIAVDIEVWGWADGSQKHMYVEVKDGKATVAPWPYDQCNFKAYISFEDAAAIASGKLTIKDALLTGKLNAIGVVGDAVKLASIF